MMVNTLNRQGSRSRGFNLVEVLISMALLGVVTISIFSLFYMGRRNVYAGRQMSQAVAIGTQVLEDLAPLNKRQIYNGAFGIVDTATGTNINFPMVAGGVVTYSNARIRSTNATIIAAPPADIATENPLPPPPAVGGIGLLTRWRNLIGTKLGDGSVTLLMQPMEDTASPPNNPPRFGTASVIKCRVIVRWSELGRQRELVLDTVKPF
jgi:prepilin-type N-terminal cleavage/methylation domain-containing protein